MSRALCQLAHCTLEPLYVQVIISIISPSLGWAEPCVSWSTVPWSLCMFRWLLVLYLTAWGEQSPMSAGPLYPGASVCSGDYKYYISQPGVSRALCQLAHCTQELGTSWILVSEKIVHLSMSYINISCYWYDIKILEANNNKGHLSLFSFQKDTNFPRFIVELTIDKNYPYWLV